MSVGRLSVLSRQTNQCGQSQTFGVRFELRLWQRSDYLLGIVTPPSRFLSNTAEIEVLVLAPVTSGDHDVCCIAASGEHIWAWQPVDRASAVWTVRTAKECTLVAISKIRDVERMNHLAGTRGAADEYHGR